jgi:hypothetical protein
VNTHVTASLMSRLPVPVVPPDDPRFDRLKLLSHVLTSAADLDGAVEYAELQAIAASLYGLSSFEFEHVLRTFPLIPQTTRLAAYTRFQRDQSG